jgi:hypothetical protein
LDGFHLVLGEEFVALRVAHLADRVECAFSKGDGVGDVRILDVFQKFQGEWRKFGIVDRRGDLDPGNTALAIHRALEWRNGAQVRIAVCTRRRDGISATGHIKVDLARDESLIE